MFYLRRPWIFTGKILLSLSAFDWNLILNPISVQLFTFCSYGLKSWEETPIDLIEDDGCATMPTVAGLYSVRSPDAIATIVIGEDTYIALANEVRVYLDYLTQM
jgi:hypothetical protein